MKTKQTFTHEHLAQLRWDNAIISHTFFKKRKQVVFFFAGLLMAAVLHAQAPTTGLVAHYPFNGNAQDVSSNGNHGTVYGSTLTTDRHGNANQAYSFDGVNDYIQIANNSALSGFSEFTISVWVNKSVQSGNYEGILTKWWQTATPINGNRDTWAIYANNNKIRCHTSNAMNYGQDANGTFALNTWNLVTFKHEASGSKVYINGVLAGSNAYGGSIVSSANPVVIGADYSLGSLWRFFNGKIDDIRIYNRALSDAEVTQLYNAEAPVVTLQTGLVAHYPFNGNAQDASGNGNHGTSFNTTFTNGVSGSNNSAYQFNGSNSYITANMDVSETAMGVSLWFKSYNPNSGIFSVIDNPSSSHDRHIYLSNGNIYSRLYYIEIIGSSNSSEIIGSSGNNYADGQWHHVVYTFGSSVNGQKIYVDGNLVASGSKQYSDFNWQTQIIMGYSFDATNPHLSGALDDIRIYNRALSDAEVTQLYNENGGFTQTSIPPTKAGFTYKATYNGKHYYIANNPTSWTTAKTMCQAAGGNLVIINDAAENTFVNNLADNLHLWIGLTDEVTEGTFVWVDGSPLTYANWSAGQPDNNPYCVVGGEDYAHIGGTGWGGAVWNDLPNIPHLCNSGYLTYPVLELNEYAATPGIAQQPQVTLSSSTVAAGGSLMIQGSYFTPYYDARLVFYGAGGISSAVVPCDGQGNFSYTHTVTSTPDMTQNGLAAVRGTDLASGAMTGTKIFYINAAVTSHKSLIAAAPSAGSVQRLNEPFDIVFLDRLQRNYGSYIYPTISGTAIRRTQHLVEYQTSVGAPWQTVSTLSSSGPINSNYIGRVTLTLNTPCTECKVRVTDVYQNTIVAETGTFSVLPYNSDIKAKLNWDYSFPEPSGAPLGVAADGTARLYLTVEKAQPNAILQIQSATVTLSDGQNTLPAMLGKVQAANETKKYSMEANGASAISATANSPKADGKIWFWYVAPDDFEQSDAGTYALAAERTVTATIQVTMSDGSIVTETLPITIVRPPLMMVHGWTGSAESFENFHYKVSGDEVKFHSSPLFKQATAVNMIPNAHFWDNASLLLQGDNVGKSHNGHLVRYDNTIQGNLFHLRVKGYAGNRVDYVCHSMGGLMLRTTIGEFEDKYYGKGTFLNGKYKNYQAGFVNKFITINTPHGGSPWADLITETAPYLNLLDLPSSFDNLFARNGQGQLTASGAVLDMRVIGGKSLKAINVAHHYIASNVDISNITDGLASKDNELSLLNKCFNAFIKSPNTTPSQKLTFLGLTSVTYALRGPTFFERYSQSKGYPNFWGSSDMVVPLASQLSIPAPTNSLSIPNNPSNATIFPISPLNLYDRLSGYNHSSVVDRAAVGNRVKELLNLPINGSLFGQTMPVVPKMSSGSNTSLAAATNKSRSNVAKNGGGSTNNTIIDTSKIMLLSPVSGINLSVDSMLTFEYEVKDTTNLIYTRYSFQISDDIIADTATVKSVTLPVIPDLLGQQTIWVYAVYIDSLGYATEYADSVSVNVQTTEIPINFRVSPTFVTLYKGGVFVPNCKAFYPSFVASVPFSDSDLTMVSSQPALQVDSSGHLYASDTTSAMVLVTYQGMTDTVFVHVLDTLAPISISCDVQINIDSLIPAMDGMNDGKISLSLNDSLDIVVEWQDSLALSSLTRENLEPGVYTVIATNAYTLCSQTLSVNVTSEVLPIELLEFKGEVTELGNLLTWRTASEENNKGFHLQRSSGGKDWKTLGFVNGNGTTTEIHQYEYLDENPALGNNYYRLAQEDFDGTISHSNTIVLTNTKINELEIKLSPNPSKGIFNLTLDGIGAEAETTLSISDMNGRLVRQHTFSGANFTIDLSKEPKGVYVLKLENAKGNATHKIVLQ